MDVNPETGYLKVGRQLNWCSGVIDESELASISQSPTGDLGEVVP